MGIDDHQHRDEKDAFSLLINTDLHPILLMLTYCVESSLILNVSNLLSSYNISPLKETKNGYLVIIYKFSFCTEQNVVQNEQLKS